MQGQPYCAAGVVDLLALFRCISCRYCFSTDVSKPELLGAPGRVFTSRQVSTSAELACCAQCGNISGREIQLEVHVATGNVMCCVCSLR